MEAIDRPVAPHTAPAHNLIIPRQGSEITRNSLVPAIRIALAQDLRLYEFLIANAGILRRHQPSALHYLVRRCMQWRETAQNAEGQACRYLGWSTSARLERIAPHIPRDEADVLGIMVEIAYSYLACALTINDLERSVTLIDTLGFRLFAPELYAVATDAGRRSSLDHGPLTVAVLKGVGQGAELRPCDPSLLDHAVRLAESWGGEAIHWVGTAKA